MKDIVKFCKTLLIACFVLVLVVVIWIFLPIIFISLAVALFIFWVKYNSVSKTPHERFENLAVTVHLSKKEYKGNCQPTILLVSGSGGGFWEDKREEDIVLLNNLGFHVMNIGYLKVKGLTRKFKCIEIESFTRVVNVFSKKHPEIDPDCVAIVGISKGSELILNLASRTDQFKAVVAMVPPHVTFQGKEIGSKKTAYGSYQFDGKELPYVPLDSSSRTAVETIWTGTTDLFNAGMLNQSAVEDARIPVENITAPVLLISGKYDRVWPSYVMANEIVHRLEQNDFAYDILHVALDGDHFVLQDSRTWEEIINFFKKHL